ncbi:hypothetical protein Z517_11830 [Fonsecaea pedrosoi CBS 271.37]|uniref:DASH complex subunit DAM1 n=1 Tax=Fonsecaea pedrosoi CBS 271.37 TaxID=1442368 RepID=A0A0D2GRK9_9EURO|nr:uncharacterized protein Z517_11830 [Fonsecaea pedrosoi CBS 271.37]KIW75059.1 hypothetical protein Z517_11830 [Fonsecaea pedrosoi CBS 271.37]
MHESLGRFGESFASFLYGLNMNAFVVDFPEAPITESIKRWQKRQQGGQGIPDDQSTTAQNNTTGDTRLGDGAGDATFMTAADASFASLKATPRRKSMAPSITPGTSSTVKQTHQPGGRGGAAAGTRGGRGTVGSRGSRGSSLPRGRARGSK